MKKYPTRPNVEFSIDLLPKAGVNGVTVVSVAMNGNGPMVGDPPIPF